MAVFKPLIFSALYIVSVRVISSFVDFYLAKLGILFDMGKFLVCFLILAVGQKFSAMTKK